MTTHSETTTCPVFFGWDAPEKRPDESIKHVSDVIKAMTYLIHVQRDPDEMGGTPSSPVRAGIDHIFSACTRQLDVISITVSDVLEEQRALREESEELREADANRQSHSRELADMPAGAQAYPRIDLLMDERMWRTAAEWSRESFTYHQQIIEKRLTDAGRGAMGYARFTRPSPDQSRGLEFHISILPLDVQEEYLQRLAA